MPLSSPTNIGLRMRRTRLSGSSPPGVRGRPAAAHALERRCVVQPRPRVRCQYFDSTGAASPILVSHALSRGRAHRVPALVPLSPVLNHPSSLATGHESCTRFFAPRSLISTRRSTCRRVTVTCAAIVGQGGGVEWYAAGGRWGVRGDYLAACPNRQTGRRSLRRRNSDLVQACRPDTA